MYNTESDQSITDVHKVNAAYPFLHGFCLPIDIIDLEIVGLLRDHRKCIGVYTCNSEMQINKALQLGVDILISDFPQKALIIRDR